MFIWNPAVILQGNLVNIIIAVSAEVIGVMCLVGALEGFIFVYLSLAARCVIGIASAFMMYPKVSNQLIGLAVIIVAFLINKIFKPEARVQKAALIHDRKEWKS